VTQTVAPVYPQGPAASSAVGDAEAGPGATLFRHGKGKRMVKGISHMPPVTLGFEAAGEVDWLAEGLDVNGVAVRP